MGASAACRWSSSPATAPATATPPSQINARANIDVLKRAGCTDILSLSAVGSLRENLAPGAFVAVDQYIDRTVGRASSFFGEGCVAHVSMAQPVCARLSALAAEAGRAAGAEVVEGRDLSRHGRPAILHPRRKPALPGLGV